MITCIYPPSAFPCLHFALIFFFLDVQRPRKNQSSQRINQCFAKYFYIFTLFCFDKHVVHSCEWAGNIWRWQHYSVELFFSFFFFPALQGKLARAQSKS